MPRILIVFLYIMASLILTSCEYQLVGEFNNEIIKPNESHKADIVLSNQSDSIVIFEPTNLQYSLNSFGLVCNALQIEYLDKKESNLFAPVGQFFITPDFSIKEWFDLKAKFFLGTGSGSIADRFKAENYIGTKTWKVKFVDFKSHDFKTGMQVNKDGFLELFWIKPSHFPKMRSYINPSSTIHPEITRIVGDTTFFTDSVYFGGNSTAYQLSIILNDRNYFRKTLQPNYPFPEIKFTPVGLDSVLVSWTSSPLRRYYKVLYEDVDSKFVYTGWKNSFKAVVTPCVNYDFFLYIHPNEKDKYGYVTVRSNYKIGDNANYDFHYSYTQDKFYFVSPKNSQKIEPIDIGTITGNEYANNTPNKYSFRGNFTGTRFVTILPNDLQVFGADLNETSRIKVNGASPNIGGQMSKNDIFGFYDYNVGLYHVVNVGEDKSWDKFSFKAYPDGENKVCNTDLSIDGKYVIWQGWTGESFIIYDISNHENVKQVYKCPISDMYSIIRNPLNSNEIIIGRNNKIEFRSLPDFQLIRQVDMPGELAIIVLNVDTYSNRMLIFSNKYFKILNLNNYKFDFKFEGKKVSYPWDASLHRNTFFFKTLKYDLSPYLDLNEK